MYVYSIARMSLWWVSHLLSSNKLPWFLPQDLPAVWWPWHFPVSLWLPSYTLFTFTTWCNTWLHIAIHRMVTSFIYEGLWVFSCTFSSSSCCCLSWILIVQVSSWYSDIWSYMATSCMTRLWSLLILPISMWFLFPYNHLTLYICSSVIMEFFLCDPTCT